ncbi:MAG: cell division protein FtsL [Clostridia bacterium]|nr:cell division protein FtsL [Clostridia bacterium]
MNNLVLARKKAVGSEYDPLISPSYREEIKTIKKPQRKPNSTPFWLFRVAPGIVCITLIFIIGLSLVVQNAVINNLGYQIGQYKAEITALDIENEKIKLELSSLAALSRIEDVAINQLGMIAPNDIKYVISDFQNSENNYVQIAGFNSLPVVTAGKERVSQNTWLGMVTEFIIQGNEGLE